MKLAFNAEMFNLARKINGLTQEDIKERIGRSPDKGDAIALTYYPMQRVRKKAKKYTSKDQLGFH